MSLFRRRRNTVITRPVARRKRRRRAVAALGVTAALIIGVSYGTWQYIEQNEFLLDERCEVAVGEDHYELPPDQMHQAALLAAAAVDRGLPPEAAVHALAASLQESELELREAGEEPGDHVLFSRGSPDRSAGAEVQQVAVTIDEFFDVLEDSWQAGLESEEDGSDEEDQEVFWTPEMPIDEAAEILQRPHNPEFYTRHSAQARAFARPLAGQASGPDMTCHLSQLEVPGPDPEGAVDELVAVLPQALDIPFTVPEEDGEEFVPEPMLEGIIEVTQVEGEPAVYVALPESDGSYDYQWMLAHWAIAAARDYGIQSVTSAPYRWDRDSSRWDRLSDEEASAAPSGTVLIGFTRED